MFFMALGSVNDFRSVNDQEWDWTGNASNTSKMFYSLVMYEIAKCFIDTYMKSVLFIEVLQVYSIYMYVWVVLSGYSACLWIK